MDYKKQGRKDTEILVHSILIRHPEGLTLDKLVREYNSQFTTPFPFRYFTRTDPIPLKKSNKPNKTFTFFSYRELGYLSPIALIRSMTRKVKISNVRGKVHFQDNLLSNLNVKFLFFTHCFSDLFLP